MKQPKPETYENYPYWIVVVSNILSISIYLIGAFIISQIGFIWLGVYLLYILFLEMRLLKKSCVNCYYFGKTCAFGKGRLSCIFLRKGDTKKFASWQITWRDILPDFMVFIIPMLVGVITLIKEFNWPMLVLLASLFVLGFVGNGWVRSRLACKYCKQRELGCPAEQLFGKKKK